jgi:hypothetical protein
MPRDGRDSGSSSIQRETRPRTTTESSTIITLMGEPAGAMPPEPVAVDMEAPGVVIRL